jgi:hypothetical protein
MIPSLRFNSLDDDFTALSYFSLSKNFPEKVSAIEGINSLSPTECPGPIPVFQFLQAFTTPQDQRLNVDPSATVRRHRCPRGSGTDARSDPNDGYCFTNGWSFVKIHQICGRVKNTVLFDIVKFIESNGIGVSKPSRFAKRRVPLAYHWLDSNASHISSELLNDAIEFAVSRAHRCIED